MTAQPTAPSLSRRGLLAATGTVTVGLVAGSALAVTPALAAPVPQRADGTGNGPTTQNGWPVVDRQQIRTFPVEGSDAHVGLLAGNVATVLLHVARRYHYEVATLGADDVGGYRSDAPIGAAFESNRRSGTAISIRPGSSPLGAAGNLYQHQVAVIRDILAECGGVVRWGGDDPASPSEGHFQVDVPPGSERLATLATTIRAWRARPGQGAGAPAEPSDPARRRAARALAVRQR